MNGTSRESTASVGGNTGSLEPSQQKKKPSLLFRLQQEQASMKQQIKVQQSDNDSKRGVSLPQISPTHKINNMDSWPRKVIVSSAKEPSLHHGHSSTSKGMQHLTGAGHLGSSAATSSNYQSSKSVSSSHKTKSSSAHTNSSSYNNTPQVSHKSSHQGSYSHSATSMTSAVPDSVLHYSNLLFHPAGSNAMYSNNILQQPTANSSLYPSTSPVIMSPPPGAVTPVSAKSPTSRQNLVGSSGTTSYHQSSSSSKSHHHSTPSSHSTAARLPSSSTPSKHTSSVSHRSTISCSVSPASHVSSRSPQNTGHMFPQPLVSDHHQKQLHSSSNNLQQYPPVPPVQSTSKLPFSIANLATSSVKSVPAASQVSPHINPLHSSSGGSGARSQQAVDSQRQSKPSHKQTSLQVPLSPE